MIIIHIGEFMSEEEIKSNYDLIESNYKKDNQYAPYCLKCKSMMRMAHTDMGWMCIPCGAIHVSKTKVEALKEKNRVEARDFNNRYKEKK